MKTLKQIQDRITFLESRQKDGIDVSDTIFILIFMIKRSKAELKNFLITTAKSDRYSHMREVLWMLED